MKKIISLFKRDYDGNKLVFDEVVPGAEWVINGEGTATRKYDGTCCMISNNILYKRYDSYGGKSPPIGFIPSQEPDEITGHWPGFIKVSEGTQDVYHREAFEKQRKWKDGTYELCGPKINNNNEKLSHH